MWVGIKILCLGVNHKVWMKYACAHSKEWVYVGSDNSIVNITQQFETKWQTLKELQHLRAICTTLWQVQCTSGTLPSIILARQRGNKITLSWYINLYYKTWKTTVRGVTSCNSRGDTTNPEHKILQPTPSQTYYCTNISLNFRTIQQHHIIILNESSQL